MSQAAFDLDDTPEPTYGVGELLGLVNAALRRSIPDGAWVRGEISGYNERGPHAYFRLVEESDSGRASIDVSFFAPSRVRLRPLLARHGLRLSDGLRVRLHGSLDVYAPTGRLSLKMDGIDPRHTLGDLALQRDAVVRRLVAAGLLDANRRTRLAPAPLRLGVVTSADSAAWADFRHELERSGLSFRVRLADVRVQGDTAVRQVSAAIATLAARADLDAIVVIRGGGARTDLATFDAEPIALAVCRSPIPVFTGLGHEIDRSIADDVAHSALKTPTACATHLVELVRVHLEACETAWSGISAVAGRRLQIADAAVVTLATGIGHRTVGAVARADDRLVHRAERLTAAVGRRVDGASVRVATAADAVRRVAGASLGEARREIDGVEGQVRLLDPARLLARGWSITSGPDGRIVRDASTVRPGDVLRTRLVGGTVTSTVTASDTDPVPVPDQEHP